MPSEKPLQAVFMRRGEGNAFMDDSYPLSLEEEGASLISCFPLTSYARIGWSKG